MLNFDAVAIGSILALAGSVVVFVIVGIKIRKKIRDQEPH